MRLLLALLPVLLVGCASDGPEKTEQPKEVNVYTHRHYDSDKALFEAFTAKTGIAVRVVQAGDDELMARLEAEGNRSPCDVLITADAGRLGLASARGLLQSVKSAKLEAAIPSWLRDPEGQWYALTKRARVLAYRKDRVDPATLGTWDDLTAPRWKGKVLVRSSENVYNQSLVAAMIAHDGAEKAEAWATGVVANMAREPKGGDTDQLLALAEGIGDVAIANSYYIGKLMNSTDPAHQAARERIAVAFPTMGTHGVHVNVSGGGVARHAPHLEAAIALLEFLSETEAQALFSEGNYEYPVKPGVAWSPTLLGFGTFEADTLNMAALGRNNAAAIKVFEAAGWR